MAKKVWYDPSQRKQQLRGQTRLTALFGRNCMASVQIHDVRKSFGGFEVLHGVSVPIEDGAFVVLVGPSGCGKSTLLRMLAGLENITSGTISIGDRVVNNVQPKERDIAMVFQNYALYPHMTVANNMGFSLKLRSASAWRWDAPSCAIPRYSCSTSPCPTSTPSCGWRCAPRSRNCISGSRPQPFTSPMTRSRPCPWPTRSW